MQTEEKEIINQLYFSSLFFERCRIPYLTRLLDLLAYCGIKFDYETKVKENQIVALGFFLQAIKGATPSMTYKQLIEHIKVSRHDYNEFIHNTHLFEIIYNTSCDTKETLKAVYVSNQVLMKVDDKETYDQKDFYGKIGELFSTENIDHGEVNLDFLIKELVNVQKELKSFFFYFHRYIQGAVVNNVGLITSKLSDNPIAKTFSSYKVKCFETCDRLNPLKLALNYYSYYADLYQINEKCSYAKKYLSDGVSSVAIPSEWKEMIFKPFDTMKVVVLEKVVKIKTDISTTSEQTKTKIMELSNQVTEKLKARYGDVSAWISVKGNEIIIVIKKKFACLNQQWVFDYINKLQELKCIETFTKSKETIYSYYKQWLNKEEEKTNSIEKSIEVELTHSKVTEIPQSS